MAVCPSAANCRPLMKALGEAPPATKNRPLPGGMRKSLDQKTNKENLLVPLLRRHFHLRRQRLILDRFVLMTLQAILVTNDLPVELVDHQIDRGVQVAVTALDKDVLAFQMQVDFNLLPLF